MLGGPTTYTDDYRDETSVVRTHSGNGPHEDMDRRATACVGQALIDAGLEDEPERQARHGYFAWATTTITTIARCRRHCADEVPQHLVVPRWSWDGRQA